MSQDDDLLDLYPELRGASPIADALVPSEPPVGHGLARAAAVNGPMASLFGVQSLVGAAIAHIKPARMESSELFAMHESDSVDPSYTDLPGWPSGTGLHATSWSHRPRLVVIEGASEADVRSGEARMVEPGVVALDARAGAVLELHTNGRRFVAQASEGRVRLFELPTPTSRMETLAFTPSTARPSLAFDVGTLLAGASCDPRLERLVSGLAKGDLVSQAIGLGYFLRLRKPSSSGETTSELAAWMKRSATPLTRAIEFVKSQPVATWDMLAEQLVEDAAALRARVDDVLGADGVAADDTELRALAVEGLLRTRDEVESVAVVLSAAGRRHDAQEARDWVDQPLRVHLSEFADPIALCHPYPLEDVAVAEPDAYWAWCAARTR